MEELWQQVLAWGQSSHLNNIILIALGILIVLAILSFVFRLVKIGLVIVVVLLLVGVSPLAITSWVGDRMAPQNFGLAKLENVNNDLIPLPTTWKATTPDGKAYVCHPDITAEGFGGLVCDSLFYPSSSVKTAVKEAGVLSVTLTNGKVLKDCEEVKEGYGCAMGAEVKLKYRAPAK